MSLITKSNVASLALLLGTRYTPEQCQNQKQDPRALISAAK